MNILQINTRARREGANSTRVALARGGLYRDTANDSQVPYLKSVLGCMGLTDLHFIYA